MYGLLATMLADRITEWREVVGAARRELAAVDLARRQGHPGARLTVAEDEAGLELELAEEDLAALVKAQRLLQTVASRLDEAGRAMLALAARLLYDVDPCRPDALAGETTRLREMRIRMPGAAN